MHYNRKGGGGGDTSEVSEFLREYLNVKMYAGYATLQQAFLLSHLLVDHVTVSANISRLLTRGHNSHLQNQDVQTDTAQLLLDHRIKLHLIHAIQIF